MGKRGAGGEPACSGRQVEANPAPPRRAPETLGVGRRPPAAGWSRRGLARAGHSPTAQWLPRGYILASRVSLASGTGAARPCGAGQTTSASRRSGSARPRMVREGSPWGAARGRAESALSPRRSDRSPGTSEELRRRRRRPRHCRAPPGPHFIRKPGRGGRGAPPPQPGAL